MAERLGKALIEGIEASMAVPLMPDRLNAGMPMRLI